MLITHPKCGKQFPSNNTHGHCSSCHETFVGIGAFDAHWVGTGADRHCEHPADLPKFWLDGDGYWHHGDRMSEELRDKFKKKGEG